MPKPDVIGPAAGIINLPPLVGGLLAVVSLAVLACAPSVSLFVLLLWVLLLLFVLLFLLARLVLFSFFAFSCCCSASCCAIRSSSSFASRSASSFGTSSKFVLSSLANVFAFSSGEASAAKMLSSPVGGS